MVVQSAIRLDGVVYVGRRHNDILRSAAEHGLGFGGLRMGEQGFVDEAGRFLTRQEARAHFIACGQVPAHGELHHSDRLDSSDLY
jgi:hypothetical protein